MAIALIFTVGQACQAQKLDYPESKKEVKETTYHGTKILDEFSWLDDVSDEAVQTWTKTQDEFMRNYVRSLLQYDALKTKVSNLMKASGRMMLPVQSKTHYFYTQMNNEGKGVLYQQYKGSKDRKSLTLPFDARAAMFILPNEDGSHLALAMARPRGFFDWKVYDVDNQKLLESTLLGAPLGDTRLAWAKDGTGFYYIGMNSDDEGARTDKRIRYHKVGSSYESDKNIYTPESPGSKLHIDICKGGEYLIIAERQGAATASKVKYMRTDGPDKMVKDLVDKAEASYIFLGNDGLDFYFQTDLGAPNGKVVSVNIGQATRVWKDLIPEGELPMMGFQSAGGTMLPLMIGDSFVIPVQKDLSIMLWSYDLQGRLKKKVELPVGGLYFRSNGLNALSGLRNSEEVMIQFMGITEPNTIFSVDVKNGELSVFSRAKVEFNADDYVSKIAFAESKDGTRIPISLTYKKGLKRNGKNYMMMQVYGAIAFTNYPYFQGDYMAWLDMGGIHAVAHIRGGGAYGSKWHQDGIARKKQNGIDDYIAALEWAIDEKYTSAGRMVINGVSAGTIPVGGVMTQRPDLVGAVVSHYGMLDMIGYAEKLGADANHGYMLPEIGRSSDPQDFEVLKGYSPYQRLKKGKKYPPVLALTSEADAPLNADSYKYIARLQQLGATKPAMLQMAWGSGHSAFGSQQHSPIETFTDEIAFLIKAMKIDVADWLGND